MYPLSKFYKTSHCASKPEGGGGWPPNKEEVIHFCCITIYYSEKNLHLQHRIYVSLQASYNIKKLMNEVQVSINYTFVFAGCVVIHSFIFYRLVSERGRGGQGAPWTSREAKLRTINLIDSQTNLFGVPSRCTRFFNNTK